MQEITLLAGRCGRVKNMFCNKNILVQYKKNQLLLSLLECFLKEGVISGFFEKDGYLYIIFS